MSAQSGFTKACCDIPPVKAEYTSKGSYETVAGTKAYVVGPADAKVALLYIYDVFRYSPQIEQGADLLASAGFRIIMPDLMAASPAQREWWDGSEEGTRKKTEWFSAYPGKVDGHVEDVQKLVGAIKAQGAQHIVGVGACWGYKVLAKSASTGDFSALVGTHPTFVDVADADLLNCPILLLCSKNEPKEICEELYSALERKRPGKNGITWYNNSTHGFLASRADLKNDEHRVAFHKGFTEAADFIKTHTQ